MMRGLLYYSGHEPLLVVDTFTAWIILFESDFLSDFGHSTTYGVDLSDFVTWLPVISLHLQGRRYWTPCV